MADESLVPHPARPPAGELRELAEEILARDEYAQWRIFENEAAFSLLDWLRDYLSWIDELSVAEPFLYWSLLAGIAIVAIGLIAHIAWTIRLAVRASEAIDRSDGTLRALPNFAAEAEALAAGGHFLEAARQLQLGCLRLLAERGFVEIARHDPNRVVERRVAAATGLPIEVRSTFAECIHELERSWFRERRATRELYERWRALHISLDALRNTSSGEPA